MPRKKISIERKRIAYVTTKKRADRIDQLVKTLGFLSVIDFLDNASDTFMWIIEQKLEKRVVASIKKGDPITRELEVASLRIALRKKESQNV